jgi:hypothetical protein
MLELGQDRGQFARHIEPSVVAAAPHDATLAQHGPRSGGDQHNQRGPDNEREQTQIPPLQIFAAILIPIGDIL